jgi:TolB-like protein/class 3 adenylate cyclase/Tfp pilus assembly protein PilF
VSSENTEQRKLAAIMFTDMVGYSALAQRNDQLALELLEEHRQLLREIFPRFNGTEIKTIGDAFLIEFNSALEAAQCAIEIQRTLAKRNHDVTAERRIELKIGIHIGDVVHRGGDVYGDGVNIASRIEQLAGAGGICVSMDVERQIRNALDARFEKLARTELKNISLPMDLFRIVLPWEQRASVVPKSEAAPRARSRKFGATVIALVLLLIIGAGWWWTQRSRRTLTSSAAPNAVAVVEKSIAVLPFENLSRDPENAFFAEGVQDEILTRLAKVADLKVIARTSTQRFKSAPDDLRQIANQLGVMNILEGSVQKANDQVRVNVQLINAMTNAHLWAETYDRRLIDIFGVESEIAKTIAESLQAKLTGSEKTALAKKPTENPEAHELYLKGRHFWNRRTEPDLKKAAEFFEQAIAKDPSYAAAYAGAADCWSVMPNYSNDAPKPFVDRAIPLARRAIELDDSLGEAHAALANAIGADLQLAACEVEFKRALALNPNYASAHQWYGEALGSLGRFEEAIAESRRAHELDPLSLTINSMLAGALYSGGHIEEASEQIRRTLDLDPDFSIAFWVRGQINESQGKLDQAIADYQKSESSGAYDICEAMIACVYARAGKRAEAEKILNQLLNESKHRFVASYQLAQINATLGNKDEAIRLLEKAYDERSIPIGAGGMGGPKSDNRFDSLRSDARFQKFVAKFLGEAK